MLVNVKLFAAARDLAGCDVITVELPAVATVGQLRTALLDTHPDLSRILGNVLFAVNHEYAGDQTEIPDAADVACIPPVSGG